MLISVHFLGVSSYYCILLNFNITETVCHTVINTEFLIVFRHPSNELIVVVLYYTQLNVRKASNMYKNIVDTVWNNICMIQYAPTSCDNSACCRLVYANHVRTHRLECASGIEAHCYQDLHKIAFISVLFTMYLLSGKIIKINYIT